MASPPQTPSAPNQYLSAMHSSSVYVIFFDGKPRGYTVTEQEAEAICVKHPQYQWDMWSLDRFTKRTPPLSLMTIHDDKL